MGLEARLFVGLLDAVLDGYGACSVERSNAMGALASDWMLIHEASERL